MRLCGSTSHNANLPQRLLRDTRQPLNRGYRGDHSSATGGSSSSHSLVPADIQTSPSSTHTHTDTLQNSLTSEQNLTLAPTCAVHTPLLQYTQPDTHAHMQPDQWHRLTASCIINELLTASQHGALNRPTLVPSRAITAHSCICSTKRTLVFAQQKSHFHSNILCVTCHLVVTSMLDPFCHLERWTRAVYNRALEDKYDSNCQQHCCVDSYPIWCKKCF